MVKMIARKAAFELIDLSPSRKVKNVEFQDVARARVEPNVKDAVRSKAKNFFMIGLSLGRTMVVSLGRINERSNKLMVRVEG